jgi:hypothetical protein
MRKTVHLLAIFMSFTTLSQAQISRGKWLTGGQVSFGNSSQETTDNTLSSNNAEFLLSLGRVVRENRVLGGNFSFNTSIGEFASGTAVAENRNQSFGAGIFYRAYKPLGHEFYLFGQANADLLWGTNNIDFEDNINDEEGKRFGGSLSVTPGIAYALFPKFHLELTLPGLFGIQYVEGKKTYGNPQRPELTERQFSGYTSISNNGSAGLLGVGFRLLL